MLQDLYLKLMATENVELFATFWDWHIMLQNWQGKGRLTCYWNHDPEELGIMSSNHLWVAGNSIEEIEEKMIKKGYGLKYIPLDLWKEERSS